MQWCRRFQRRTSPRPVRDIVRPARPDRGCEREKVRPARSKWPKISVFWRAGRTLSRASMRRRVAGRVFSWVEWGRGRAGRILSRLPAHYCHRPWLSHSPSSCHCRYPRTRHRLPAPSPYFVVPPAPPHQSQWGFGSIRSWLSACRRRVGVLMTSFPHVVAVRKRFEAKEQTTLMNNADNGLLWVRRSCGRKRSLGDIRRQPAVLGKVVCV